MENHVESESQDLTKPAPGAPIRWKKAVYAGLMVGFIFLLVTRGLPWTWSGLISPTLMGRELKPPGTVAPALSVAIAALHVLVSVCYALLLAPIVHRMSLWSALLTGAGFGLVLYLLNFLLFSQFFPHLVSRERELAAAVTHVAFGIVVAGAYKGMAKRRVAEAVQV
jgi:hypothetical protein